jgi:putative metalloprotease
VNKVNKLIFLLTSWGLFLILTGCITMDKFNTSKLLSVGKDLFQMTTLSDIQISQLAKQSAKQLDSKNRVASTNSKYTKRLKRLIRQHDKEGNLNLNYKVYLSDTINAFAMPDGTIRIYSGLMDKMNDQEVLYVIGHEIGHVVHGHTKQKLQIAYAASAGRKMLAAYDSKIGQLAGSQLGVLIEKFVNAQFSQSEEKEADDYSLQFMQKYRYKTRAAISALNKLAQLGNSGNNFVATFLSSHPSPKLRAERLQAQM